MEQRVHVTSILVEQQELLVLHFFGGWTSRAQNQLETVLEVILGGHFEAQVGSVFQQVTMIFRVPDELAADFREEDMVLNLMEPVLPGKLDRWVHMQLGCFVRSRQCLRVKSWFMAHFDFVIILGCEKRIAHHAFWKSRRNVLRVLI